MSNNNNNANKLVDKYQYRQNQTKIQGNVEYITAKHIVTKQNFTLKKINLNDKKTYGKYLSIINQMNILKALNGCEYIMKCHKMLKTSNNLYVVFNLIGSNPNLQNYLCSHPGITFQEKKTISIQLINILKLMNNSSITVLQLNPKYVQICKNLEIKLTNLETFILNEKRINLDVLKTYEKSQYMAPEVVSFLDSNMNSDSQQLQGQMISDKFSSANVYSLGRIMLRMFKQGKGLFSTQNQSGQNLKQIHQLIESMLSLQGNRRPSLIQIESALIESKQQSRRPKIKISTTNLRVSPVKPQLTTSNSKLTIERYDSKQNLHVSPVLGKSDFDIKSMRSSKSNMSLGGSSDAASPTLRKTQRKCSILNYQKEPYNQELVNKIVLKIMKRRNLCRLLLNFAKILLEIQFLDQSIIIMLAFLLIKKSVLLICALARYLSTGKGQLESLVFKESLRRQFSKTDDYQKLESSLKNEMNNARNMFINCGQLILKQNIREIKGSDYFDFESEFQSQTITEETLKLLVKKVIYEIVIKINMTNKPSETFPRRKSSKNFLNNSSTSDLNLFTSNPGIKPPKDNKFLEVDDFNVSVRSANTIRVGSSRSSVSEMRIEVYDNRMIEKFLSHRQIGMIYLMSLVLDYENYEQVFEKMVNDQQNHLENYQLIRNLDKMEAKQIALSLQQIAL